MAEAWQCPVSVVFFREHVVVWCRPVARLGGWGTPTRELASVCTAMQMKASTCPVHLWFCWLTRKKPAGIFTRATCLSSSSLRRWPRFSSRCGCRHGPGKAANEVGPTVAFTASVDGHDMRLWQTVFAGWSGDLRYTPHKAAPDVPRPYGLNWNLQVNIYVSV